MSSPPAPALAGAATARYQAVMRTPPATSTLEPMPAKRYPTAPQLSLPWRRPPHPAVDSFEVLAALLWSYAPTRFSYASVAGLARLAGTAPAVGGERWWHDMHVAGLRRPVPSGGGYHPVELYAAVPDSPRLAAGVYHYESLQHALAQLRAGDARPDLARAIMEDRPPHTAVFLACRLWKNASKYGNLGYHLTGLDAGAVLGQLLAEARRPCRVWFFFSDDALDRLLGVDPDVETGYTVIGFGGPGPASEAAPIEGAPPRAVGHDGDHTNRSVVDAAVLELAAASRTVPALDAVAGPAPVPSPVGVPGGGGARRGLPVMEPPPLLEPADRRSPVNFRPGPIRADQLSRLLAGAVRGFRSDIPDTATGTFPVALYCVTPGVRGVPDGVHYYDPAAHELVCVRDPAPVQSLMYTVTGMDPQMALAPVSVFAVGSPHAAAAGGERWYRITTMLAGVMLQRLCRTATAMGLGARPNLGYDAATVAALLRLPPEAVPLIQVLIGHPAPRPGCLDLRLDADAGGRP